MNYHYEIGEMNEIVGVVTQPGWKHIKRAFVECGAMENDVGRICGDPFQDGQMKGRVDKMREIIYFLNQVEKNAAKHSEGDAKDV